MSIPINLVDIPLRILVENDLIGAIIGLKGKTIRKITQETHARVDVNRKRKIDSVEKSISIFGIPNNCTQACKRILEVMQEEARAMHKNGICLQIIAYNNQIPRIIGKNGTIIKEIMHKTNTHIIVSPINEMESYNLERIIKIKGDIEHMSLAESLISKKLRHYYETDLNTLIPQSALMFPGLDPMVLMSTPGNYPFLNPGLTYAPPSTSTSSSTSSSSSSNNYTKSMLLASTIPTASPNEQRETTHLYVPQNTVGAIIGVKGAHIQNIRNFSNATVILSPDNNESSIAEEDEAQKLRKITIIGTPNEQWKAQLLIYEKIREQQSKLSMEDLRLTLELLVPRTLIGRIIGKGGQNVRDMQRFSGSLIQLPEPKFRNDEELAVRIIGSFYSVQYAQRRIRELLLFTKMPAGMQMHLQQQQQQQLCATHFYKKSNEKQQQIGDTS